MSERRIVALNNGGVDALSCGRIHEAMFSFRHAMACLKRHKEILIAEGAVDLDECFPPSPVACRIATDFSTISPSNMFEIYQCAFLLPKNESIMKNANETVVTLAYNLALAVHLVGLREQNEKLLMEALRYYKLAVAALQSHVFSHVSNQTRIFLGSITNLGHIYSHFWDIDKSKECGDFLFAILSSFSDDQQLLQDDHYSFFCGMAFGVKYSCHSAPAA